jgi:hypothetical protein
VFSEVRMQERAHNAPEWRYMAVCGDGTARPGVEKRLLAEPSSKP